MNNRALSLSLVMAAIAVFFVWSYVSSFEENARKKFGTEVSVLKAKRNIKEMENISDENVVFESVLKNYVEPSAITFEGGKDDEKVKSIKGLLGTVALVPLRKGEQITLTKITDPGARTGVSSQVTPGKRAMAIPVSEVSGVGKLVKPGDRVDLIVVLDTGGGKDGKIAKVLLQDVVVLAVGRNVSGGVPRVFEADGFGGKDRVRSLASDTNFTTVTLEVEPSQSQTLALVLNNGDNVMSLSLRNNDDTERVNLPSQMLQDVLGPDLMRTRAQPGRR